MGYEASGPSVFGGKTHPCIVFHICCCCGQPQRGGVGCGEKEEKTKIRGRISRAFEANQGIKHKDTNFELELIKVSLTKLKNENADIQQLIKL